MARSKPDKAKTELPANTGKQRAGRVLPIERDEVQRLHERRAGLNELILSLQETPLLANPLFYDKVVTDLGRTVREIEAWWEEKAAKYAWGRDLGGLWSIDFNTCDIFLSPSPKAGAKTRKKAQK